jgi:hypothetical protein
MKEEDYYQRLSKLLKPFVGPEKSFNIVYLFSDEASGYSQKIEEDYQFGLKIKKYFPYLSMGGFGAYEKSNPKLESLNRLFDFGFFSSLSVEDIKRLQNQKLKWGFYNAVPTNLDDPRFAFGAGLFLARKNGLSHYLEWNSIGFNQYPYFDFDGRESDIVLFYPSANGGLQTSVRFELARVGLATFRKLMLLEDLIKKPNVSAVLVKEAREFIQNTDRTYRFNPSKSFLSTKAPLLDRLNSDLDKLLLKISKNE